MGRTKELFIEQRLKELEDFEDYIQNEIPVYEEKYLENDKQEEETM